MWLKNLLTCFTAQHHSTSTATGTAGLNIININNTNTIVILNIGKLLTLEQLLIVINKSLSICQFMLTNYNSRSLLDARQHLILQFNKTKLSYTDALDAVFTLRSERSKQLHYAVEE